MHRGAIRGLALGWAVVAVAASAAEQQATLLANGGFEHLVRVPGVSDAGGRRGSWALQGGPQAPAHWTLSSHFGGTLTVSSDGAHEGKVCLRIQAPSKRDAHVWQVCDGIWSGGFYRVSIRYRGGPVAIKAYEYRPTRKYPFVETIVDSPGIAEGWQQLEGTYWPHGCTKVSIAASVAAGWTAEIDDFRVWQSEPETAADAHGWLNVKNHGVSGSAFEATAATRAGARSVTVAGPGDFKVGQGVMVSKCNVRCSDAWVRGPKSPYRTKTKLDGRVEVRGFDGAAGDWLVYVLEINGAEPLTFRWSDDQARTWKGQRVPITHDWQDLSAGVQVRFRKSDWQLGHLVHFTLRTELFSTIEKIDGNTLWLSAAPNRSVADAVVRHCDSRAIQSVIKKAIGERKNVFFPAGHYRLSEGMLVQNAAIRIEGASGEHTVMDISRGVGAVFHLLYGDSVTIRNFRMVGHGSRAGGHGGMKTSSGYRFWCMALKPCRAVHIKGTERVLVENVHASHMACESFYCQGPYRHGDQAPPKHTKSLTFLRCSVEDSAHNAFNNNDASEGTSVLYCRAENVGAYAYEGPGRFIKIKGTTVRNCAGGFVVGNMDSRHEHFHQLGCGQAIISGNVLEGTFTGRAGIDITRGASQVVVANNVFVNCNGNAIRAADPSTQRGYAAYGVTIADNVIDMTCVGSKPRTRSGIEVSADGAIVSNNQVYVRGEPDRRVTGICIKEPATNVRVGNNLVRHCGKGIATARTRARVTDVVDERTFLQDGLPLGGRWSHAYRGWTLAWMEESRVASTCPLEGYDVASKEFRLVEPCEIKPGARFEVFPPRGANWAIEGNTVDGCLSPVVLESYGSATSVFRNNVVTRGRTAGVKEAIVLVGRFHLIGNHVSGFDETGSTALALRSHGLRRCAASIIRGNTFGRCAQAVTQSEKGLWPVSASRGNTFLDCGRSTAEHAD